MRRGGERGRTATAGVSLSTTARVAVPFTTGSRARILRSIARFTRDAALVWLARRPATLIDEDLTVDFSRETTPNDVATVVATGPLTRDECWTAVAKRSSIAFRDGTLIG
jgi:predicted glutamine amidotransferase